MSVEYIFSIAGVFTVAHMLRTLFGGLQTFALENSTNIAMGNGAFIEDVPEKKYGDVQ